MFNKGNSKNSTIKPSPLEIVRGEAIIKLIFGTLLKNLLICCLFFSPLFTYSQQFDFNPACVAAYQSIIQVKLKSGQSQLNLEQQAHPKNLIPVYLENYIDFLHVFISNNDQVLDKIRPNVEERIRLLKKGNQKSPWYLYTRAEVHLQYALLKIMFKEYVSGLFEIRKAYKLLETNIERHPDFKPSYKSFGLIKTFLGAVPPRYYWGLRLLGMEGNLNEGLEMQQKLIEDKNPFIFKTETIYIYSSLLLHFSGKSKEAWQVLMNANHPLDNNLFSTFNTAKIALYSKHNDEAISMLENIPTGSEFETFPILDYYKGLAYLNKLEPSSKHFIRFIENSNAHNLIKAAYQKIAWSYMIKNDTANYFVYLNKIKKHGTLEIDADKQAQTEATMMSIPNVDLLKARLLFDGGYFQRALTLLQEKDTTKFYKFKFQLEYTYRLGRIYDELGQTDAAITYYEHTLKQGKKSTFHYAANAALNLGTIYESKGEFERAEKYFKQCLTMDNHTYKNSIDQKARIALERFNQ